MARLALPATVLSLVLTMIVVSLVYEVSAQTLDPSAGSLENLRDLELLDRVLADYKNALNNATGEDLEHIKDGIDRLELAKQLFIHSTVAPGGNQSNMTVDEYNAETSRLLDLFKYDVPNKTSSDDGGFVTGGQSYRLLNIHSDTHTPSQYDCQERKSTNGKSVGVVKIYSGGRTTIDATFTFPEDFYKKHILRRTTSCDEYEHNKAWMRYNVLLHPNPFAGHIQPMTCLLESTSPIGRDSTLCNALVPARFVTVITGSEYESSSGRQTQLGNLVVTTYISGVQ